MATIRDIPEVAGLDTHSGWVRIPPELDVPLTGRVRQIIDTAEFRRLSRISQLGLVSLVYPAAIEGDFKFSIDGSEYRGLHDNVVFVALKNGEHNGTGYFLDTGLNKGNMPAEFPLAEIPRRIMHALNIDGPQGQPV